MRRPGCREMNEPITIYKPVFRCSNCGSLVDDEATECDSCPAVFGETRKSSWDGVVYESTLRKVRHHNYSDLNTCNTLVRSVPNGCAVSNGIGGVGTITSDHYLTMSENQYEGALTWRSITKALTIIHLEGYTPNVMLIHPYQMHDILLDKDGKFVGASEKRAFELYAKGQVSGIIDGNIGYIAGMSVIVSNVVAAGLVVIFDSERFPENQDAGVLLTGGRTELQS